MIATLIRYLNSSNLLIISIKTNMKLKMLKNLGQWLKQTRFKSKR